MAPPRLDIQGYDLRPALTPDFASLLLGFSQIIREFCQSIHGFSRDLR
jgi:hypothetical protein